MKDMMNNIYFVSALAAIALCYVLYTASPFLFSGSDISVMDEDVVDPLTEPLLSDNGGVENFDSIDTDLKNLVVNWSVYPKRNPFAALSENTLPVIKPTRIEKSTPVVFKDSSMSSDEQDSAITLQAIIVNEQNRFAVVNDTVVSVGERLMNFEVISIEPHFIEVRNQFGRKHLAIHEALYEN